MFNTLRNYQREWLSADLAAGLVVAILLVPQGIAYAFLAGLPPQAGLYAALLPLFIYAMLGTSPSLAVGPAAIVSLMTLESLQQLSTPGSAGGGLGCIDRAVSAALLFDRSRPLDNVYQPFRHFRFLQRRRYCHYY